MRNSDIVAYIDRLLQHAINTGLIDNTDRIQKRNELADLLRIDLGKAQAEIAEQRLILDAKDNSKQQPALAANQIHRSGSPDSKPGQTLTETLHNITDYAAETGLIPRDTITYRDLFDTRVMGVLTPRQSEIIRRLIEIRNKQLEDTRSIEKATEYFYSLCQASNYIRTDRIKKNRSWLAPTEFGDLAITVNLSKPEKDPRDIAEAASKEQSQYPKCVLCLENVGYAGSIDHQARQNLRVIPLTLGGEQWYFQYSPYVYYNEHCILISEEHRPLVVDRAALERMLDFVQAFPHYFVGSNAGLPIVGGSILNHDHYQGGREIFPLDRAPFEHTFVHPDYPDIAAGSLKWPMAVVRLSGPDRESLLELASLVMDTWQDYEDRSANIIPYTVSGTDLPRPISHNAVTPTVRMTTDGTFVINLVLRNNRTTSSYPYGLFHPRPELHHIKKENIGVIEVMGMAILPSRLDKELDEIRKILCGEIPVPCWEACDEGEHSGSQSSGLSPMAPSPSLCNDGKYLAGTGGKTDDDISQTPWSRNHMLHKHKHWIGELVSKYGNKLTASQAEAIIKAEVGNRFLEVLLDASVFKRDTLGQAAFQRFIKSCGFVETQAAVATPTETIGAKT